MESNKKVALTLRKKKSRTVEFQVNRMNKMNIRKQSKNEYLIKY